VKVLVLRAMGKGRDKRRRKRRKAKTVEDPKRMAGPPMNDLNDPDATVYAALKPKPRPRSGAIALPEPDDTDDVFANLNTARISK
jgi:hypothetical protein